MSATVENLSKQAMALQYATNEIATRFQSLSTFPEASQWDSDATALVSLYEQFKNALADFRLSEEEAIRQTHNVRNALPFFKRLFASRKQEKAHKSIIGQVEKGIKSTETAISQLLEWIDQTPSSKAEQKEMLGELRLLKKELMTEKRTVNESMRAIRTQARQNMSTWTGVQGKFIGSVARVERMQIRHQKESALTPHEDAKAAIERQIIACERRINWISKFTGEDPKPQEHVVRCAYCGRRVSSGKPCPGCGSDQTTREL
jgi:flagellar motility protein MotE (MotC chaperone)